MKAYFFYRPRTDAYLSIDTFFKSLNNFQKSKLQVFSVDTPEGDRLSRLYQLVRYPSVIVASNDGTLIKMWHGELPIIDDLAVYLSSC